MNDTVATNSQQNIISSKDKLVNWWIDLSPGQKELIGKEHWDSPREHNDACHAQISAFSKTQSRLSSKIKRLILWIPSHLQVWVFGGDWQWCGAVMLWQNQDAGNSLIEKNWLQISTQTFNYRYSAVKVTIVSIGKGLTVT